MGHRPGIPITVELDDNGFPRAFRWRGVTYHVRVIAICSPSERWNRERQREREYYRLMTSDQQVFEISQASPPGGRWVLDRVVD